MQSHRSNNKDAVAHWWGTQHIIHTITHMHIYKWYDAFLISSLPCATPSPPSDRTNCTVIGKVQCFRYTLSEPMDIIVQPLNRSPLPSLRLDHGRISAGLRSKSCWIPAASHHGAGAEIVSNFGSNLTGLEAWPDHRRTSTPTGSRLKFSHRWRCRAATEAWHGWCLGAGRCSGVALCIPISLCVAYNYAA